MIGAQVDLPTVVLVSGWIGMLGGALSGAIIGVFFHDEHWQGGYGAFPRRMIRLGHVSFFGLGILNVLAGLTLMNVAATREYAALTAGGFVLALITMPICCLLAAWRKPLRHLFPLPVLGVFAGIASILSGWLAA